MRVTKKTGWAVAAALLLGVGLKIYAEEHLDDCDRFMAGDLREPSSVYVKSGTRTIMVPCNLWVMRQPAWVEVGVLVEGAVVLVGVVFGVGDWRGGST